MSSARTVLPTGYRYFWYDEVASTNSQALLSVDEGVAPDSWFCANQQSAGRGTRGAVWESPEGNLYASFYFQLSASPRSASPRQVEQLGQISLLAGLAGVTAMEQLADNLNLDDICLKWPNDILLEGSKVCGILVESQPVHTGIAEPSASGRLARTKTSASMPVHDVIIGTGINITSSPEPALPFQPLICRTITGAAHGISYSWLWFRQSVIG